MEVESAALSEIDALDTTEMSAEQAAKIIALEKKMELTLEMEKNVATTASDAAHHLIEDVDKGLDLSLGFCR